MTEKAPAKNDTNLSIAYCCKGVASNEDILKILKSLSLKELKEMKDEIFEYRNTNMITFSSIDEVFNDDEDDDLDKCIVKEEEEYGVPYEMIAKCVEEKEKEEKKDKK